METVVNYIKNNWPEVIIMGIAIPIIGAYIKKIIDSKKEKSIEPAISVVPMPVYQVPALEKEAKASNELKVDDCRSRVSILFVDDDTKFKVVSILKQAGWLQTRIVKDLKSLNDGFLQQAHIVFVDIQGVGKSLSYPDEGLGLAASIKKKYPQKKLIIYSADSEGKRFHEAFRLADDQLSKNAVPYEFETVIETMTAQLITDGAL
jgi:DNA-binding NarL/FixJ family response regulator